MSRVLARVDKALQQACEIIEVGDARLLAADGPAGGQVPDISLEEWGRLWHYVTVAREDVEKLICAKRRTKKRRAK